MAEPSPACPFIAGPMITDPSRFIGRREELTLLARRMSAAQPTSINIYGERRIGKSSLLSHFCQTWEQRVSEPARFVVLYLDLQARTPRTEAAFYQALARELAKRTAVYRIEEARYALNQPVDNHRDFAAILDLLAGYNLLPVFCLDEFEVLIRYCEQFTDSFYDHLRGFMNASQLMFVLSSRRPLAASSRRYHLTSAFFNLGHVLELGEFCEEEVKELLLLPLDGPPALDQEERQKAREWGRRHPCWLQLAALCLWEARQAGKTTYRARKAFEEQRKNMRREWIFKRPLPIMPGLQWLGERLGEAAKVFGSCNTVVVSLATILLVLLLLFKFMGGSVSFADLIESFKKL